MGYIGGDVERAGGVRLFIGWSGWGYLLILTVIGWWRYLRKAG